MYLLWEMTEESTKHLDRVALYATYSAGIGCNASTKRTINMTKLGFKERAYGPQLMVEI